MELVWYGTHVILLGKLKDHLNAFKRKRKRKRKISERKKIGEPQSREKEKRDLGRTKEVNHGFLLFWIFF